MIRTLLIANRGEIACRIVRTCAQMGIRTVAVYAESDRGALHVRSADQAVALVGFTAADSYLDQDQIIAAARRTGADAIHPGYGFLSERADFAAAVTAAGLLWVGPSAEAIAAMGDKIAAKQLMAEAGVPVLPSVTDQALASEVGYPLIVKAAAGGGGKGMRIVTDPAELDEAVAAARREAGAAFGDDRVFLERYVERPRHIEVQVFADSHGTVVHVGERECSIQRRHQKVIEEAPSPAVDDATRTRLGQAAVAAARAVEYVGAGTVEFVAGQPTESAGPAFYFLEMNTRLQVEHPVTELAWERADGLPLDLVRLQLEVAEGRQLPFGQEDLLLTGHAVEARLYAEDAAAGFLPATGTVELLEPAGGPGVRWDTGVATGDVVGPHFDPLLAKVVARGQTRADAIRLLEVELAATRLHGLTTNRDALVGMLTHPDMQDGTLDTGFIDRLDPAVLQPPRSAEAQRLHLVAATLMGRAARLDARTVQRSLPGGWRNNRSQPAAVAFRAADGEEVIVHYRPGSGEDEWAFSLSRGGVHTASVGGLGQEADPVVACLVDLDREAVILDLDGRRWTVHVSALSASGTDPLRRSDAAIVWGIDSTLGSLRLTQLARFGVAEEQAVVGSLSAPMPGAVLSVAVEPGQVVAAGDQVMVLEAMKMEHKITAPLDGTVESLAVSVGDQVEAGDTLAVIA